MQASKRRGMLSALAIAANCRPAHLSMVLSGKNELSQDQAYAIGRRLHLSDKELDFFLILVQSERAGTAQLREHLLKQLAVLRQQALTVSSHIKKEDAPSDLLAKKYYSSWEYAAVHILVTIPAFRTLPMIASRLGISVERASEILFFLIKFNIVVQKSNQYLPVQQRFHIPHDSPYISFHHMNWRMRAIENAIRDQEGSIHYTSVISLSQNDMIFFKKKILEFVAEIKERIRDSKEEEVACFSLDFFAL